MLKKLATAVIGHLPYNRGLEAACHMYAQRFSADHNYDPRINGEFAVARRLLPRCRAAFDVGANVGEWSRYAVSINPSLQLHSFEPVEATFKKLGANAFPAGVTLNNCGLGAEPGALEIHRFADPGFNTLYDRDLADIQGGESIGNETIRIDTFDNYCEAKQIPRVDFVKVDVEGHELKVFAGMRKSLGARRVGTIQFEYGDTFRDAGTTLRQVFELAAPHGGVFYKILPRGLKRYNEYHASLEVFGFQNWLIVFDGSDPSR